MRQHNPHGTTAEARAIRAPGRFVVAAVVVVLIVGPATAADKWTKAPSAKAREIAARYATCIVKTSRAKVEDALAVPFGDDESGRRLAGVMSSDCLTKVQGGLPFAPSALSANRLIARALLVEALYHADFDKSAAIGSFTDVAPVDYRVAALDGPSPTARDYRALMRIGDCMVRAMPVETRALVVSKPGSKAEDAADAGLDPARQRCVPQNTSGAYSAEIKRGMVAEPLYRLTKAKLGSAM